MKILKLICFTVCFMTLVGCSSSKKATPAKANSDEVEVTQLCHTTTDAEHFYANSVSESSDMQMAKDKATLSARAELAANITIAIENFTKRYRKDVNNKLDQKTEDRLQTLVKQTLSGSTISCDRITRSKTGQYRAYITVRLAKKEVASALEKALLENRELKLNFDQAQFDKIADEAITNSEK